MIADSATTQPSMIETAAPSKDKKGKVISVVGSRGGSGRSTISLMLGGQLALSHLSIGQKDASQKSELRVCVVDMDIRDGQIGFLLGHDSDSTLDITSDLSGLTSKAIKEALVYSTDLNIHALPKPHIKDRSNPFQYAVRFYTHLISQLQQVFDVVILDTGVTYADELLLEVVYPLSDLLLYVTVPSLLAVSDANIWFNQLSSLNNDYLLKTAVVLNKSDSTPPFMPSFVEATLHSPVIGVLPVIKQHILRASWEGEGNIAVLRRDPTFYTAILQLWLSFLWKT